MPKLRVRSFPGLNGKIIATVSEGQNYNVIEKDNGWCKINYKVSGSIQAGWVMSKYTR